jgi:hypothetical protein
MRQTYVSPEQEAYVAYCEDYAVNKLATYELQQEAKKTIANLESKLLPPPESQEDY